MSWTRALARVREHEVEEARKRLGLVVEARAALAREEAALAAERAREVERALQDPEALFAFTAWRLGFEARLGDLARRAARLDAEEAGCRDALAEAFAELKKVERLRALEAERSVRATAARESAVLDEAALRAAARAVQRPPR